MAPSNPTDEIYFGLFEAGPDALLAVEQSGSIALANQQVERLFGYTREEIVGRPLSLLVPDEHQGVRKDGSRFFVDVRRSTVPSKGDLLSLIAIRDTTESKRAERRSDEANRLKSEFLANMSHELRTPLNAIIGFAELMHKGKVGPLSPQHQEFLGDILTSSRHLLQLINDVLDLAKVESGKMEFRPQHVDVHRLVLEVKDVVRGLAASKRLRMDQELDPAILNVVVDPSRTKQILYNYLSNAIKFTPDRGRVVVRICSDADPRMFRIEVEDTGIGIPEEGITKLFVEFQQLDASSTKKYAGTGLGLALTKRLAEAHGGRVEVRSEVAKGSNFAVILPREQPGFDTMVETP